MKPHFHIAIVLLWRDNEILAAKRRADAEHLPDVWEFPGGKCAPGEAPANAALREAREELGVKIEILGARAPLEFDYPARLVTRVTVTVVSPARTLAPDSSSTRQWYR